MTGLIANGFAILALLSGALGLYYMYKLYRIPARPFWNHWQTGTSFFGSMLSYGALMVTVVSSMLLPWSAEATQSLVQMLATIITLGLLIEVVGHYFHASDMKVLGNEGAASHYRQTTQYGKSYRLRNYLLVVSVALAVMMALTELSGAWGYGVVALLMISMLITGAFGRSLFFVLVVPMTMPGAFFWKNDGFVEHARKTGLAESPQHGVVYERHHVFKANEIIQTIKQHSIKDMIIHVKWIFGK